MTIMLRLIKAIIH